MPALDELLPLYLKACEVEGKTDRTVQSYGETLRHFITAVARQDLPHDAEAFRPAHVYLFDCQRLPLSFPGDQVNIPTHPNLSPSASLTRKRMRHPHRCANSHYGHGIRRVG